MIAFLRELAAIPLIVLFYAADLLKLPIRASLARWIWVVTGQLRWAQTWIWHTAVIRGVDEAGRLAEDVIQKTRDARIPAALGIFEYATNHNPASAYAWAHKADELCTHHKELLLYLKMLLSPQYPEYNAEVIAEEIILRNDLPMDQTRAALFFHLSHLLYQKNWSIAESKIAWILSIEEIPIMYCYRWIVYMAQGRLKEAQDQLVIAGKKLPKSEILHHQGLGMYLLDRIDEAKEYLKAAIGEGLDINYLRFYQPRLANLLSEPETKTNPSQPEGV